MLKRFKLYKCRRCGRYNISKGIYGAACQCKKYNYWRTAKILATSDFIEVIQQVRREITDTENERLKRAEI